MFGSTIIRGAFIGAVALAATVATTGAASAATAVSAADEPESTSRASGLWFAGYDAKRAAEWGYEVRTDAEGWQYAVPAGTPPGSLEGASPKFNPATSEVRRTGDSADAEDETVNGDCGTSSLELKDNTRGVTGYHLNGAFGAAVYHTWGVTLISSIDAGVEPLDGTPPIPTLSFEWNANFEHSVQAIGGTVLSAVAGGTVTTVLGSCFSGAPHSEIVYR